MRLALLIFLTGCEMSNPGHGTPILGCLLYGETTAEEISIAYRASPHRPSNSAYDNPDGWSLRDRGADVLEVRSHPCCDFAERTLGYAWHCRFYPDKPTLQQDLVLDRGWARAAPQKRVEIATATTAIVTTVLTTPPAYWNPYKPFHAPTAEVLADGGVKLTHWVEYDDGGGMSAPAHYYARQEETVSPSGAHVVKELERYPVHGRGYPDPKVLASCDATKPPTREWIMADVLATGRSVDELIIENPYKDVWSVHPRGYPQLLRYYRRCHSFESREAVVADILDERGWAMADAAKRIALATEVDEVYHPITTPTPDWPGDHPFVAPSSAVNSDGTVTLTRWLTDPSQPGFYTKTETVYMVGGRPWFARVLDKFMRR